VAVQLHLVPPTAPYFKNAEILVCADCVAFAMGSMHQDLLKGKALAIACPNLMTLTVTWTSWRHIFDQRTPAVTVAINGSALLRGLDVMVKQQSRRAVATFH